MHILLVASAFNSLTQRIYTELAEHGHSLGVSLALGDDEELREAVRRHAPDLVVAPMLTTAIPEDIWSRHTCLIVHPGPPGDRGPSSLDWAIAQDAPQWGVTVLEAVAEMDAGDVWAWRPLEVAPVGKSELYRGEVADAAVAAVQEAVERYASRTHRPAKQAAADLAAGWRCFMRQPERAIDWSRDSTAEVLRRLRAADSQPGVLDELLGERWYLHGGHAETELRGAPGTLLATRDGAVCRATVDGAVWLPHLRPVAAPGEPASFKRPAVDALGARLPPLPEVPAGAQDWSEIRYEEHGDVGLLWWRFAGGAMGTAQCQRLLAAWRRACERPTRVLVFGSERDFFSNGIHLNLIEAAPDPAAESWANINAMNDLVQAILCTTDRLVVAALGGNAAAGGAMLALAADEVWCREGAVLNPHYRLMGLHGSEYWTYTLPRRVGTAMARQLTQAALPVGAQRARALGLVDRVLDAPPQGFGDAVRRLAATLAAGPGLRQRIAGKAGARARDEAAKPLQRYRDEELAQMRRNFFEPGEPYHALRSAFVRKHKPACTPEHLVALGLNEPRVAQPLAAPAPAEPQRVRAGLAGLLGRLAGAMR
ncbi:hydrogenase maturation protein [Comamonas humi]